MGAFIRNLIISGLARVTVMASLLALQPVVLLVAPAWGWGSQDHRDWDTATPLPHRMRSTSLTSLTYICDGDILAALSMEEAVHGEALVDVFSISIGSPGVGSSVPYFCLSPLQQLVGNWQENPHATTTMSLT